jgi:hypothetical protein
MTASTQADTTHDALIDNLTISKAATLVLAVSCFVKQRLHAICS